MSPKGQCLHKAVNKLGKCVRINFFRPLKTNWKFTVARKNLNQEKAPESCYVSKSLGKQKLLHYSERQQQTRGLQLEGIWVPELSSVTFPESSAVENQSEMQEMRVWFLSGKISWRRQWQPTSGFLTEKSHRQKSLMG